MEGINFETTVHINNTDELLLFSNILQKLMRITLVFSHCFVQFHIQRHLTKYFISGWNSLQI